MQTASNELLLLLLLLLLADREASLVAAASVGLADRKNSHPRLKIQGARQHQGSTT